MDDWIKKMWGVCVYKMEYYSVIKQKETSPLVTAWIAIEGITLSETRQTEKDKYDFTEPKTTPKNELMENDKLVVTRSMGWRMRRARDTREGDQRYRQPVKM